MIKESLEQFNSELHNVCDQHNRPLPQVVLVTKFVLPERIMEAYEAGHRLFGENRVQELIEKKEKLPGDIQWHFVGHLQTNKVKSIVGEVDLIHSVDSIRLAEAITAEAEKKGIVQKCLIQTNTSSEDTKFGVAPETLINLYKNVKSMQYIDIEGLMTIGAFVDNEDIVRANFRTLQNLRNEIKETCEDARCSELSMGMSGDWQLAVEEGATIIRIGSLIFGERI
ncbi:YggS family pyridoxal phosphate-dependent enzyme [Candidatus Omnitrophota bacterium]